MVAHLLDYCGKDSLKEVLLGWDQVPNWECLFVHRQQGQCLSVCVDDMNLAGRKESLRPMWDNLMRHVDLGEPTSFFDHVYLGCTQRECKSNESIIDEYRNMFESRISAGATENYLVVRNRMRTRSLLGLLTWKVIRSNARNDTATWRIKRFSNCFRFLHHVLMTINSKRNAGRFVKPFALKSSCNVRILNALVDLGRYTNWHERSHNERELVTNAWLF